MEFTGTFKGITQNVTQNGVGNLTVYFELNDDLKSLAGFDDLSNSGLLKITATKWRKKRSLDANAYCWVLIRKIAEKLNINLIEVYRKAIEEVGVFEIVPIKDEAVDRYIEVWSNNGLGWICDKFPSKLNGYTNIRAYYGSSVYDTKEMSRLIDNIVTECQELGIETLPENELQSLIDNWR